MIVIICFCEPCQELGAILGENTTTVAYDGTWRTITLHTCKATFVMNTGKQIMSLRQGFVTVLGTRKYVPFGTSHAGTVKDELQDMSVVEYR